MYDLNGIVHSYKQKIAAVRAALAAEIEKLAPEKMPWISPAIRDGKTYTLTEKAKDKVAILKRDCRNHLITAKEHSITKRHDFEEWTNELFTEMREFREREVYELMSDLT
jgi:hypothetical protein